LRLTILHTNDLHGHEDQLARIGTLVSRVKAEADHQVLYLDAGYVEETMNCLSPRGRSESSYERRLEAC
jgi:hypothetical protein